MASIQHLSRVGVDPHANTLVAAGIDAVGAELFHLVVPNTHKGIDELISTVDDTDVLWALEGTGTYSRALCDQLLGDGRDVVEVPTRLTGKYRTKAGRNKTDRGDAVAIAQASLKNDCAQVSHLPVVETLRVLVTQRQSLVDNQVETVNRIRARLRELDPDTAKAPRRLRSKKAFLALAEFTDTNPTPRPPTPQNRHDVPSHCLHDVLSHPRRHGDRLCVHWRVYRPPRPQRATSRRSQRNRQVDVVIVVPKNPAANSLIRRVRRRELL